MKITLSAAIIALTLTQPVLALDYDPYNEKGRAAQEQADATNPQILALRKEAMKQYWYCVTDGMNMDPAEAQKLLGPVCNFWNTSWLDTQIRVYHMDHQQ